MYTVLPKTKDDVKFEAEAAQPVPFQVEDAHFILTRKRCVLGHPTGLGKTVISLIALRQLIKESDDEIKVLILGTLSSISVWKTQVKKWLGVEATFIEDTSPSSWRAVRDFNVKGIFLATYTAFRLAMKNTPVIKADILILDEIHRYLRNRKTITYKTLKRVKSNYFIGLSATWASRGAQDLWPVLNLINPAVFSSYWQFVNTWCFVDKGYFGNQIYGVRHPKKLRETLWGKYYTARTWKDVGAQFGSMLEHPVIRRAINVTMSPAQTKMYKTLEAELILSLENDDDDIIARNSLALLTKLLQLALCPKILAPNAEYGAVIQYLVEAVSDTPHTVIFCPYKAGLKYLKEALIQDGVPEEKIFQLQGGIRPEDLQDIVAKWKLSEGIMLCTIAFAESFSLDTVDVAYMLGFDWDPNQNIQAEGRLRRLDSNKNSPCLVNYIVVEGTAYHDVREVINGKAANTAAFLRAL